MAKAFKATLSSIDFQTKDKEKVAKEVNLWAEKETKGTIKNLLQVESINSLTILIFANALYFKGTWEQEFETSIKLYDRFHLLNGESVKASFMTNHEMQFISVFDGFKVLGLPYKKGGDNRQFSMYIFLPNATNGLLSLIKKIASKSDFLEDKLPRRKVEVGAFKIPKFNISFDFEASDMLKELGVILPFSVGEGSLTKVVDRDNPIGERLYVSNIFQNSFIQVNEEGTEVAAATFFNGNFLCVGHNTPPPIDFVADHPFLFLIREDLSGTILFIGQVLNPLDM